MAAFIAGEAQLAAAEGKLMQLEFFPSKTLTLYLARLFVTRIIGVLLVLVLVLQMLDLLSESGKILGYAGNGEGQLWSYMSLRTPQLIARFLPYSVLLATIVTLATLNQNSEVISMKAAGLSAHQVLAPLLLSALVVSAISFTFNMAGGGLRADPQGFRRAQQCLSARWCQYTKRGIADRRWRGYPNGGRHLVCP